MNEWFALDSSGYQVPQQLLSGDWEQVVKKPSWFVHPLGYHIRWLPESTKTISESTQRFYVGDQPVVRNFETSVVHSCLLRHPTTLEEYSAVTLYPRHFANDESAEQLLNPLGVHYEGLFIPSQPLNLAAVPRQPLQGRTSTTGSCSTVSTALNEPRPG